MSSKRARRNKRKENQKVYNPNQPKPVEESKKQQVVAIKLPGQTWVKVGSILLMIGGVITAASVFLLLQRTKGLSVDELRALIESQGSTPVSYGVNLVGTSIIGLLQAWFGIVIFKNSKNPFFGKTIIILCAIIIVCEVLLNLATMVIDNSFLWYTLLTGTTIPIITIIGAKEYIKYAKKHPDFVAEPIKFF